MLSPYLKTYGVVLAAFGNPDHGQDPTKPLVQTQGAQADTIEELSKKVREFIEENNLGAGNWTGGEVYEVATNKVIGRISYNGRFWPNE